MQLAETSFIRMLNMNSIELIGFSWLAVENIVSVSEIIYFYGQDFFREDYILKSLDHKNYCIGKKWFLPSY